MMLLNKLFSSSRDKEPPARPVQDCSNPQYAANFLLAWAMRDAREGPADPAQREGVLKYLVLRGYQPSKDVSFVEFEGYSPEKRQICYALDAVKEHGTLIGKTAQSLEFLGDTGKVEDPLMAAAEHAADLAYYKPSC